jgi:hypothetical protein
VQSLKNTHLLENPSFFQSNPSHSFFFQGELKYKLNFSMSQKHFKSNYAVDDVSKRQINLLFGKIFAEKNRYIFLR